MTAPQWKLPRENDRAEGRHFALGTSGNSRSSFPASAFDSPAKGNGALVRAWFKVLRILNSESVARDLLNRTGASLVSLRRNFVFISRRTSLTNMSASDVSDSLSELGGLAGREVERLWNSKRQSR